MTVIYLKDVRREREMRAIYVANEIQLILGESDYPRRPEDFATGDLRDFVESVCQVLDDTWIAEVLQEPDASQYIRRGYQDALCSARVLVRGEFKCVPLDDGSVMRTYTVRHLPGDEAYHGEALDKARSFLLEIADDFGIPALREVARA